ncbi:MAG: PH domain-containing protein [Candidatus Villigracilaceae bacterium]
MSAQDYQPLRQRGLIVHTGLLALLLAVSVFSFASATHQQVGLKFTLYLLAALAAFIPLPLLAYRLYALQRAYYRLDRDALTLSWGLRLEQLPLDEIEWVRPASDLTTPLLPPPFSLPGAVLGLRHHPDLGTVEFLASERRGLLLVATARRVFAISPLNPAGFARDFQRMVELGSLEHAKGRSLYPTFILSRAWESPWTRFLWLSGFLLNLGLLAWVSLLIPSLKQVHLGFTPGGSPLPAIPAVQLIFLPVFSLGLFALGWLAGLFYYRRPEHRVLSMITWTSSTLSSLIFILAVWINLSTG